MTNDSAEACVIRRSVTEPNFRAQLTAEPKSALAAELGVELPADMVVRVIEEDPNTVYVLLPPVNTLEATCWDGSSPPSKVTRPMGSSWAFYGGSGCVPGSMGGRRCKRFSTKLSHTGRVKPVGIRNSMSHRSTPGEGERRPRLQWG